MDTDGPAAHEVARLAALASFDVLDSAPEPQFDDLVALAASVLDAPISTITLVDGYRQWFKAKVGLQHTWSPREDGLCENVVTTRETLVVPDLAGDERFSTKPVVAGAPFLRFYAGTPLTDPDGQVIGALCVMDIRPRVLDRREIEVLDGLGRQVMAQLLLRRSTQQSLVQSGQLAEVTGQLTALLDHAGAPIYVKDRAGRFLVANRALHDLMGAAPGTMSGRPAADFFPAAMLGEHLRNDAAVLATGSPQVFEERVPDAGGTVHDYVSTKFPVADAEGELSLVGGISLDVTGIARARAELEEARQRYEALAENSTAGIAVVDAGSLTYLYANTATARMRRARSAAALLGEPIAGALSEHRGVLQDLVDQVVVVGQAGRDHVPGAPFAGTDGPELVDVSATSVSWGGRSAVQIEVRDVTEQVGLERRTADSETRAWQMLHAMPDAVVVADIDGLIELVNAQAVALFGYEAERLIGQPVETLIPDGLRDTHSAHRAAYVATDDPQPMSTGPNVFGARADGTTFPVEVNLSSILLGSGRAVLASVRDVTEPRRLQLDLSRALDQYRDVLNGAVGQSIIATDLAGRITMFSEGAARMTGYREQQMLGRTAEILHDVADTSRRAEKLGVATDLDVFAAPPPGAPPDTRQATYVTADGRRLTVLLTVTATHDSAGEPSGFIEVATDVTADRIAEDRIRDSEDRFRLAFDAAPIGMALTSMRAADFGRFLRVNQSLCKLTGYSEAQLLSKGFSDLTHPDDRQATERAGAQLASGEIPEWHTEKRYVHADGHDIWVRLSTSVVVDSAGAASYTVSQIQDVTAQRAAGAVLEERFRELAGNVNVGFALRQLDPPEYLYVNPAFLRVFGYDPQGPTPTPAQSMDVIHPEDRERGRSILATISATGQVEDEWRLTRPDGTTGWVSARITSIADPDGVVRRVAGVFEDITVRKLAEDAVLAARAEAERANAAKDEFLSRLSHELRTPLNAVLGFAQLLELDALTGDQDAAVGHILKGGRHLLRMIDDILDITGIDADRMELSPEPVELADVVRGSLGLMQPLATAHQVRIHFDATQPESLLHVRADRRRLMQVMLNLLSNAIKYNHVGGRVDIKLRDPGDGQLAISVVDTGIGIPPEALSRLFSPFDRLGRQALNIEGTGIGLVLARRLTTLMGGHLEVESSDGRGSTFTVTLPSADAPAGVGPTTSSAQPQGAPGSGGLCSLVYIEDNPSNVDLLSSIMRRRPNWTMTHASTGHAGLEQVLLSRPTVVLLDLHLPDIDGIEVLQALRASPTAHDVPVAVLSADAGPHQVGRLLAAGAQQYLAKPINVQDLLDFLDAHAT